MSTPRSSVEVANDYRLAMRDVVPAIQALFDAEQVNPNVAWMGAVMTAYALSIGNGQSGVDFMRAVWIMIDTVERHSGRTLGVMLVREI